jgi:DNA-binding XRE family transcriptional regulator
VGVWELKKVDVRLYVRDAQGKTAAVVSRKTIDFIEDEKLFDILLRYMRLRARIKLCTKLGRFVPANEITTIFRIHGPKVNTRWKIYA